MLGNIAAAAPRITDRASRLPQPRSSRMRFSAYFIGLCVVLIAASLGAVAYLLLGLSPVEAGLVAASVMSLLTAYQAVSGRAGERAAVLHQITDLSRGTADLARQVGELGRRTVAVETAVTQMGERTRAATDPVSAEIEVLGTLVKQLAESVAAHEIALLESVAPAGGSALPASSLSGVPIPPESATKPADISASPSRAAMPEERGRVATMGTGEILAVVRAALEANRVDLYLQPIVTLPQRKVRYYEALARLRTEDGALILPTQYLGPAESGGLMPLLDNLMLFRSVQVVRRITAKNREVGLFCNIAESTLVDGEVFPQFFEFLNANRALAPALILQFSQRALRAMGPIEHESLAARTAGISVFPRSYQRSADRVAAAGGAGFPL